ncbi:transmembrane protein [Gossypium australe]|uniref:Transmembrane protein n=1 Tax=Gossypium australe TaxID=47621 RepID=A0A5B6VSV8_9ROSI|nr:transmembrane protein [Gossypium australe]
MGQNTSSFGNKKRKDIDSTIDRCYKTYFEGKANWTSATFFRAICDTIEELNKKLGSPQLSAPKITTLNVAFEPLRVGLDGRLGAVRKSDIIITNKKEHKTIFKIEIWWQKYKAAVEGKELSKEGFQEVLQEVLIESGFSGIGAKDIFLYLFGVPVTALMIKRQANLKIHDDIFIPAITSATVFLLAKLNKI